MCEFGDVEDVEVTPGRIEEVLGWRGVAEFSEISSVFGVRAVQLRVVGWSGGIEYVSNGGDSCASILATVPSETFSNTADGVADAYEGPRSCELSSGDSVVFALSESIGAP